MTQHPAPYVARPGETEAGLRQLTRSAQMHLLPVQGGEATKQFKGWIAEHHYLHGTPPEGIVKLWVFLAEERIGALMFGRPCSRLLNSWPILELTRVAFLDATPANVESRSLALARKYIRTYLPNVRLLVSYASDGEGHKGGIYQADGWCPFGRVKGMPWGRHNRPRATRDMSDKTRWVRTP